MRGVRPASSAKSRDRSTVAVGSVIALFLVAAIWLIGPDLGRHQISADIGPPGPEGRSAAPNAGTAIGAAAAHPAQRSAIEGIVVDDAGDPVAGAAVLLDGHAQVTSGAGGHFRFDDVAAGAYHLNAHSDAAAAGPLPLRVLDGDTTTVTVRLYPGVTMEVEVVSVIDGAPVPRARGALFVGNTLGDAGRVEAVADDRGVLRFPAVSLTTYVVTAEADGFAPATRLLTWNDRPGLAWRMRLALEPGVMLTGRVVDEGGGPVAGAQVTSRPPPRDSTITAYRPRLPDRNRPPVATDAEGRFRYPVPRGQALILRARHQGLLDGESGPLVADSGRDVTITLRAGRSVHGRVLDGQGAPVAGATVGEGGPDRPTERTDGDGRFTMRGIDPRQRNLVLRAEVAGARSSPVAIALPAGFDQPVELVLEHELSLRGAVVHADGSPVADAIVGFRRRVSNARSSAAPPATVLEAAIHGETRADQDGAFAIDGLASGTYELLARVPASGAHRAARPLMASVDAQAGDDAVSLVLPAAARIRGQVVDAGGRPVPDFTISLAELGGPTSFHAADGRFELADLDPGLARYQIHVLADRAAELTVPATVAPGETTDVGTLRLARGRLLSGRVLDTGSGGPVAGAVVSIDAQGGPRVATGRTDELGAFSIPVPEGPVVVHAAYRGVGGSRFITLPASQESIDLRLPEKGQLEVEVVTGAAPGDLAAFAVSAQRTDGADGGIRVWVLEQVDGQAIFRGDVSPGPHVVHLGPRRTLALGGEGDTDRSHDISVIVEPDKRHRVTISLEPGNQDNRGAE